MDFGQLLTTAQNNDKSKREIKYYSTKFEPPKKEQRSKQLSVNIQKFLEKQKEEERKKALEAQKRKDKLLTLRSCDKKATRRVNVMLKRTKSANQSVIQDAIDNDNTAVTLAGPVQPDEDDYGYVSQEASAYYNKMMEKYAKMPDEPKFDFTKKKVNSNLNSTKNRVKAALDREREEAMMPHKRKRKQRDNGEVVEEDEYDADEPEQQTQSQKPKPKPMPPPLNFADLLKIAEKKQFEPIVIETKVKEEEKLLTKKQKQEMQREREWKERKEARSQLSNDNKLPSSTMKIPKLNEDKNKDRNPKVNSEKTIPQSKPMLTNNNNNNKIPQNVNNGFKKPNGISRKNPSTNPSSSNNNNNNTSNSSMKGPILHSKLTNSSNEKNSHSYKPTLVNKTNKLNEHRKLPSSSPLPSNIKSKDVRPQVTENRKLPPAKQVMKPKEFPPKDLKPKQFPPTDLKRKKEPPFSKMLQKKKKRQVIDSDSEYDSEMDDFIDDGDDQEDYSKYISEIFGYDKRKYRDYDDVDVDNMESTFAQQMREEVISKKLGIMEDLEDMRMEEAEKKRKAMKKRK